MELTDKDLLSVQQARDCIRHASVAHRELATFCQEQIDKIVAAIAKAGSENAERLAKMAQQETGFGKWEDKVVKNKFASDTVYNAIKNQKTVGILRDNKEEKVLDIGTGVGVIAGIVPSTNPTSTVIFKAQIAIKGGNSIVFSPHPGAKDCIIETVRCIASAAEAAGCPKGAISCIEIPTLNGTKELMRNSLTKLILATGGPGLVREAYSSGKPAIGVGAGNGPAYISKSADISLAVRHIFDSKTFDNGTICASEQSIITEKAIASKVEEEIKKQGGCILDEQDAKTLGRFILRPNGSMNPAIVGKSACEIAALADLKNVPQNTRVLLARETKVGAAIPFSHEKLAPILAYYVEDSVDEIFKKCIDILHFEGAGHTFIIHTTDESEIRRFALAIPASRILVNTPGSLGGIGATTGLFPSLTLGCGAVGGSSSSNNIGPMDVINIKRVAYGLRELSDLKTHKADDIGYTDDTIYSIVESVIQKIMQ